MNTFSDVWNSSPILGWNDDDDGGSDIIDL